MGTVGKALLFAIGTSLVSALVPAWLLVNYAVSCPLSICM
jgi:hypothetical protein